MGKNIFADAPVIYSYTRAQALEDGVLIDVTEQAKGVGFKVPVAVGDTLYYQYIVPSKNLAGQSLEGRLHDVLFLAYLAAMKSHGHRVIFDCDFVMEDGQDGQVIQTVSIVAVIDGGDDGAPVITICLPGDE